MRGHLNSFFDDYEGKKNEKRGGLPLTASDFKIKKSILFAIFNFFENFPFLSMYLLTKYIRSVQFRSGQVKLVRSGRVMSVMSGQSTSVW